MRKMFRSPKANGHAIVYGERIGLFHIGMTVKELKRLLGEPDYIRDATRYGTGFAYTWRGLSKEFRLSGHPVLRAYAVSSMEDAMVYSISVFGIRESAELKRGYPRAIALHREIERYRTSDGFGIGSTMASVAEKYGEAHWNIIKSAAIVSYKTGDRSTGFGFPNPDPSADNVVNSVNVTNRAALRQLAHQMPMP